MGKRLYPSMETKSISEALHASSLYQTGDIMRQFRITNSYLDEEAKYIDGFRPSAEQYRSILSQADRILVDACPGAGKTAAMIIKIICDAKLYDYKNGDQLVLTYTNKAAEDMYKRYKRLCSRHKIVPDAEMSTIHAFANMIAKSQTDLKVLTEKGVVIEILKEKEESEIEDEDELEGLSANSRALLDAFEDEEEDESDKYEVETRLITENSIYSDVVGELGLTRDYYNYIHMLPQWINTVIESNITTDEELNSLEAFADLDFINIKDLNAINDKARETRYKYGVINFTDMLISLYSMLKKADKMSDLGYLEDVISYKHIYVDEFQDISELQWNIIMELLRLNPNCKLFCVGDEDQSIFSFRGSSPKFVTNFEEELEKSDDPNKTVDIISYTVNRRSGKSIIDLASAFIDSNKDRYSKEMKCIGDKESSIQLLYANKSNKVNANQEISEKILELYKKEGITGLDKTGILYREHKQGSKLIRQLIRMEIPVVISDETGLNTREMDDILGILDMLHNPTNPYLVEKYLYKVLDPINKNRASLISLKVRETNKPFSQFINQVGIANKQLNTLRNAYIKLAAHKSTEALGYVLDLYETAYLKLFPTRLWRLEDIRDIITEYDGLDYWDFKNKIDKDRRLLKSLTMNSRGVKLTTFHSSKGLEFDTTFILPISDEVCPKAKLLEKMSETNKEKYIAEERRLLYVAITRAKHKLIIYSSNYSSKFTTELRDAKMSQLSSQPPTIPLDWGI